MSLLMPRPSEPRLLTTLIIEASVESMGSIDYRGYEKHGYVG